MVQKFLLSVIHRRSLINALLLLGVAVATTPVLAGDSADQPCAMTKSNDWGSGFTGEAVVRNESGRNIGVWSVRFNADFQIDKIWNAQVVSHTNDGYVIQGVDYNATLAPGAEVRFGFVGSPGNLALPCELAPFDATPAMSSIPQVSIRNVNDWGSAFQGEAQIVNTGSSEIIGWNLAFDADFEIQQIWNARIVSHEGSAYVIENADWNRVVSTGGQVGFGFIASPGGTQMPAEFVLNGMGSNQNGSGGGVVATQGHENLTYQGPGTCLECHEQEAYQVHGSTHYQWQGEAAYMIDGNGQLQGKIAGAINTYCGSIEGNWEDCSSCHVGLGAKPEADASRAQLENIDCLVCHQIEYKRKKINGEMVPDTAGMSISMDEAVQTVHKPTKENCLNCHAKAGGGDAVKRGDLALASGYTADAHYDVHMASTGANLDCQDCHKTQLHRFQGKGSDLRASDSVAPLECASAGCHDPMPHQNSDLNEHTAKVACQTCHIPVFAKHAEDSSATEATEINRSWQSGSDSGQSPYHPLLTLQNDLKPTYRHWNRYTDNYNLGEAIYADLTTGNYSTSLPDGSVDDSASKLYPFKYKTSDYPLDVRSNMLIPLDTKVFFDTADANAATLAGLQGVIEKQVPGFNPGDRYEWVTTDTYQALNHQVGPKSEALSCESCHLNSDRIELQGALGYTPRDKDQATCSSDCHESYIAQAWRFGQFDDFKLFHVSHKDVGASCLDCHDFSR